jgi:hypothetical protein
MSRGRRDLARRAPRRPNRCRGARGSAGAPLESAESRCSTGLSASPDHLPEAVARPSQSLTIPSRPAE